MYSGLEFTLQQGALGPLRYNLNKSLCTDHADGSALEGHGVPCEVNFMQNIISDVITPRMSSSDCNLKVDGRKMQI